MEGRLFGGKGLTEALDPVSRMILESKDNVAQFKKDMDRGENSLITLLFCACCNWFDISANPAVWYELSHDTLIVGYDDPAHHHEDCSVEAKMTALNEMLVVMDTIPFYYDGTKLLKIREVKFDEASVSARVLANVKFKVSEDIIPLLIEPLYKKSNKMEIVLRELLQNAIDACKFNERDDYSGRIEIAVRVDLEKATLSFFDNGIGMNLEDIENYYLTVGKSKKINSDLPVVGQFGIGALTMFLIGRKAVVHTKKSSEDEYRFNLFKDSTRISELTRRAVKGNESFTRIDIEVDHESSKPFANGLNDVVKHLGIDRRVINSENLDVVLKVEEGDYQVPNLSGIKDCFVSIYEERNRFLVEIYEEDHETAIRNEPLARTVKTKNLLLYNDILITAAYLFSDYKNLNTYNIPFLVIAGKIDKDEVSVELSRESAVVGDKISGEVARYIYKKEIRKITDYLAEHQGKETNAVTRRNALVNLTRASLKLPKLLLAKNRVEICGSKITSEVLRYGNIAIVRSNTLSEIWLKFPDNTYYVIEESNFSKSSIADLLIENETMLLSNRFLQQYVLQASGSNNGFRRDALKYLMRDMLPQLDWETEDLNELWSAIDACREQIKMAIEEKSLFGIYCYGRPGKSEVERLFNKNVEHRDVVVYYKRLDDYYFRSSYDKTFDALLNAAML
ncbi:ATP-binding protein [Paenibacillus polymyxa]|uniref:ATP-binding protein n=1 Tax=Paenibacillus polymyxa TaxID=1406 RepID=UPI00202465A2|nr:ATP-binding protein [Paenibacillus polymyxa]MDU8672533.1 ATP-binding protein [Paenibacillus polymyxa]MDU8697440.1 ATP-binding protein [Paenibacillus polymyxa]URJ56605.1 ATP-binding protein [Paenibacillus polymyxa]URJ64035.3 ATP-binding protein [Paenibacillus polymyxa]URJ71113.1 ATP-binding protein [Paenibacillus polymyxa]